MQVFINLVLEVGYDCLFISFCCAILISSLKAIAISPGNTNSKISSFTYTVSYNSDIGTNSSNIAAPRLKATPKKGDKVINGAASPLSTVTIKVNGKDGGTAKTDSKGNFTIKLSSALKAGDKLELTYKINNKSSAPLNITIK
ncbi:MAG: Ig-like domain-containing protein [Clostridia bacterium]|nr:Ig-like domain-containing protein [Clostridia bacterium]